MNYDVIVIGAGIMGSATAYYLSLQNKKVLLLDQYDLLHDQGSSHGDSRIIRRSYNENHFAELMNDAYYLWNELENQYNNQFIVKTGGLDFGTNSTDLEKVQQVVNNLSLDHELLNNREINTRFPGYKLPEDHYGIYQPDAGIVLASKALQFFQSKAIENGVQIASKTEITSIANNSLGLIIKSKEKVFQTKKLVLTVGSWINKFFDNLGLEYSTEVLKVNFGYWKTLKPELFAPKTFPIFINWDKHVFYGFPILERPNHIKIGAHFSFSSDNYRDQNNSVDENVIALIKDYIERTYQYVDKEDFQAQTCYYTMTPKENFILDVHPENSNILFGGGFSGHGFKFAPLIGKILSNMAQENDIEQNIDNFSFKKALK